jgi:hypothetical protein
LSASSSDPQHFSLTTNSAQLPLNQQTIVKDLLSNNQFTITLNKEHCGPFADLNRVHLNGLRVWPDGAKPVAGKTAPVKLQIQTNGLYEDFSDIKSITFATRPLKRAFWYEISEDATGGKPLVDPVRGKILIDAVIPQGDHSPPTPFVQVDNVTCQQQGHRFIGIEMHCFRLGWDCLVAFSYECAF